MGWERSAGGTPLALHPRFLPGCAGPLSTLALQDEPQSPGGFPAPSCPLSPLSSHALGCPSLLTVLWAAFLVALSLCSCRDPATLAGRCSWQVGGPGLGCCRVRTTHPGPGRLCHELPHACQGQPVVAAGLRSHHRIVATLNLSEFRAQIIPKIPHPNPCVSAKQGCSREGKLQDPSPCLEQQGHVLVGCSGCKPGMPAGRSIQPKPHPCLAPGHSRGGLGGCTALRDSWQPRNSSPWANSSLPGTSARLIASLGSFPISHSAELDLGCPGHC